MKHLFALLIGALFGLASTPPPCAALDLSDIGHKISNHQPGVLYFVDYVAPGYVDPAIAVERFTLADAPDLAWQPAAPSPAFVERVANLVPPVTIASGYRKHAWLACYRIPEPTVSTDLLGLTRHGGPRNYDHLA